MPTRQFFLSDGNWSKYSPSGKTSPHSGCQDTTVPWPFKVSSLILQGVRASVTPGILSSLRFIFVLYSGGSKDPELQKHLEAAKRAASALFSCKLPLKENPNHRNLFLWKESHSFDFAKCIHTAQPPPKKRKSRWGSEEKKTVLPGLPTILPSNMKEEEQKLYICELTHPLSEEGSSDWSLFV